MLDLNHLSFSIITNLSDMDDNVERKRAIAVAGSSSSFNINDHSDVLIEILTRLDDSSLCIAACVCRLWCSLIKTDTFWEMLCFRNSSPPPPRLRQVVVALGGYKKLYMVCVRRRSVVIGSRSVMRGWTMEEVQLWVSLFCVDCYERLGGMKVAGGDGLMPSLMFLRCEPVNV